MSTKISNLTSATSLTGAEEVQQILTSNMQMEHSTSL